MQVSDGLPPERRTAFALLLCYSPIVLLSCVGGVIADIWLIWLYTAIGFWRILIQSQAISKETISFTVILWYIIDFRWLLMRNIAVAASGNETLSEMPAEEIVHTSITDNLLQGFSGHWLLMNSLSRESLIFKHTLMTDDVRILLLLWDEKLLVVILAASGYFPPSLIIYYLYVLKAAEGLYNSIDSK